MRRPFKLKLKAQFEGFYRLIGLCFEGRQYADYEGSIKPIQDGIRAWYWRIIVAMCVAVSLLGSFLSIIHRTVIPLIESPIVILIWFLCVTSLYKDIAGQWFYEHTKAIALGSLLTQKTK